MSGTVKLIFQPAEEGGAGAEKMCEEGVLEDPAVDRIFGLHVSPFEETGDVASRPGPLLAAAGTFEIVIKGKGGHAAMPHLTIDPVVTAAKLTVELQTIISRELDPLSSGVVSVTAVNAGKAAHRVPTNTPTSQNRRIIPSPSR